MTITFLELPTAIRICYEFSQQIQFIEHENDQVWNSEPEGKFAVEWKFIEIVWVDNYVMENE